MQISITKDGDGFLAQVVGKPNLYAFAYTEKDAIEELKIVVDMMLDYYSK